MKREATYRLRLPIAIVAAVALVVVLGLVRPNPLSSRTAKDAFWTAKVFGEERYNLIFSGDSRIYRGISPAAVEAELAPLELKAFNFGFSSGGHNPLMAEKITQRLVASGPRAVVLGLSPHSLTPKSRKNGHLLDLLDTSPTDRFLNLEVAPRILFLDPIEVEEIQLWMKRDSFGYYEEFMPAGWVASRRLPMKPEEALASYRKEFVDNQASQALLDTVLMQVREWRSQGIQVFAFRPPTTDEMVAVEDSLSGFPALDVRRQWEAAGGIWLDPGPNSDYVSYDGSHVDWGSAKLLSARLARAMRPYLEP